MAGKNRAPGGGAGTLAEEPGQEGVHAPAEGLPDEKKPLHPFVKLLAGLSIAMIMVLSIIPYYTLKADPSPGIVPSFEEVFTPDLVDSLKSSMPERPQGASRPAYRDFVMHSDPLIKMAATQIAAASCSEDSVCHAKAIHEFVAENFKYVSETDNYIQLPTEMIVTRGGDCEDMSILAASLFMSVGVPARLVFVPNHVYVDAYLPGSLKRYQENDDGWVSVDPACSHCGFGVVAEAYRKQPKTYLPLY